MLSHFQAGSSTAVKSIVTAMSAFAGEPAEVKQVESDVRDPWHTTDLYWRSSKRVADVKTIGVTFTVDRDVPDTVNLYIAPMGGQHLNGVMFYGGIQSNVNGWPSPTEKRRVHPGPGAIFSMWGKDPVDITAARPELEKGGLCESAGYEGHFASVRLPIDWKAGDLHLGAPQRRGRRGER